MADLPSILGGMAQGFLDFGKSAVDLFGTGGASIADLIESARTGKVTTKNSDDFRKWLYDTNDVKDAAAKGLGTALNGVQTVSDYIPGIGAVTRNPLFNAGQGALGGLADEFKMYGKDYDLGRAGQRAAVSAGGALASTGLADALKGSGNALLKSGTAQGLARGAVGGAIGAGGYTAIDGGSLGDVANSALQGAGMGAALGGTMGALQDFRPARTYDMALTDEEKAARIANAKNMLANEQDPERIAELNNQIKSLGGGPDGARNYKTFATGDEAREYFSKSNPAYWDGLPSSVDEGIQEYTRNGYSRVNDMLRTGQDNYGYPDTDVLIGDIERGIEGYNLPDDIKVYRRSTADAYKNLGVGDTFTDEGFTSTSVSPNIGGDFGKANIEINVGNGKGVGAFIGDLSSGNGDEGEFLLQRGTKYKVLGRGKDGTLQLEVVGNERRPLEQILSASDAAVNSPRYITDENGNPRTFYHGSPNANITEFDINQAGKNTMSGEHALYFTDSPEVADEFSYERIPTDSLFVENRGAKGRVYPVNLEMNNPLDLDNLTDAQIDELWPYASYMGSWQGKDVFTRDLKNWRDVNNAQLIKGYLDMDKLASGPYDGFIARMYPNQDNQAREYAVFDNSKIKMLEDVLAADDAAVNSPKLTPEQEAYFKDSVIRDENGSLIPMYHGTRGNFTVFGDNAPSDTSNSHASVGSWFTPTKEGAKNFAESIWYGDEEPRVMETYLNVKNPKIYETVDNSKAVDSLVKELRELELNSNKLSDTELFSKNMYDASMAQRMLEQEGKDTTVKWLSGKGYGDEKAAKFVDEIADLNEQALKKKSLQDRISELRYGDAYQRFKTDIYKMDGQTAEDANVGGTGMALNDRSSIKKYVDKLKSEGYDGIIIKGTRYDADTMGGPNDQYVVFDSNQIKSTNNLKPTSNPDIYRALLPFIGIGGLGGGAYMANQQKDKEEVR